MDEKAEEKQHEKIDEKRFEEKSRRDPLSSIIWAAILIWVGVALLANNLGILESVPFLAQFEPWSLALTGAGVIVLVEVLIRLAVPEYSGPVIGTFIFGLILLSVGMGDVMQWDIIWPIVVIVAGLSILLRAFRGRS
ncbi:MAG: hypothetical protein E4G99_13235 [Anaerolineales bacterium]|nr:MAG: hypothetical protein E4G99_13235 [Anaerolineales bacterium]